MREINKINERELELGATGSWHDDYKGEHSLHRRIVELSPDNVIADSAYIFVGGLHSELTEGDVITIFSQYVSITTPHELGLMTPDMEKLWT